MESKKIYVWATDKTLSGWGVAEGKIHKQVAECPDWNEADRILNGFEKSNEFKHVNWGYNLPYWPASKYTHTIRPSSEWTRFK